MGKTKTFGMRLTPELIAELERLRDTFGFTNYSHMIDGWIGVLQDIDSAVTEIQRHPREWEAQHLREHLGLCDQQLASRFPHVDGLALRRLKERFGEDGVQRVHQIARRSVQ
jgi:hypothetical protein